MFLCASVSGLHGCIVPIPHQRPDELSSEALAWAVPGVGTRRDFILKLGDPLFRQRDDTIFVYAADATVLIWFFGSQGGGGGGYINKTYFVLVRFGAGGKLEEVRLADGYMKDPCVATGFCDPLPSITPWQ